MSTSSSNKHFDLEYLKRKGLIKKGSEVPIPEALKVSSFSPGTPRGGKQREFCSLKKLFPGGEFIDTPFKQVFKLEKIYPPDTSIGRVKISDFFKFLNNFDRLFSILEKNDNLKNFQFEKLLFFDVESTGLSSGAGNVAFMIGLGFFNEKKDFVIQQYFIEDYINEKGLLFILEEFFKEKYHLISFNGKSFDYYLLKNRFILSRKFSFTLDNLLHFDLLHSGRRMWKNMFSENTLNNLEKMVLKFRRTDKDIPGFLIPEFYKNYLKSGNARVVEKIFYHNLMDIRSMLGLLIIQMQNLQSVLDGDFPEDINYNTMASLIYNIDKKLAIKLLDHTYDKDRKNRFATLKQLYIYYKKDEITEKYEEILLKMIKESREFNYFPYCELSMHFEHRLKQPDEALNIINKARSKMDTIMKLSDIDFTREIDDIIKRAGRLEKKCFKSE